MSDQDVQLQNDGRILACRRSQAHCVGDAGVLDCFTAMGIALPGAVVDQLLFPSRRNVAVTDGEGFLMNPYELEAPVSLAVSR